MSYLQNMELIEEFCRLSKEAMASTDTKAQRASKKKTELDMWHTWNEGGQKPHLLKPLYESFKPMIHGEANKFVRRVEIPSSAIHEEFRKQFVHAVKTYNPNRGTQLGTWVQHNLRKASRFVKTYQNIGKLSEGDISKIRKFNQAKEHLYDKMGHEPDTQAIADHLGWSSKQVARLQKGLRKDLSASGFEGVGKGEDPTEMLQPKELEAVRLLQYDTRLSPEERSVYEYTFGLNGKPRLQPGEIAKRTGLHPSKVSRVRTKIKGLITEAVEVL